MAAAQLWVCHGTWVARLGFGTISSETGLVAHDSTFNYIGHLDDLLRFFAIQNADGPFFNDRGWNLDAMRMALDYKQEFSKNIFGRSYFNRAFFYFHDNFAP